MRPQSAGRRPSQPAKKCRSGRLDRGDYRSISAAYERNSDYRHDVSRSLSSHKEVRMNWDQVAGNWKQLKGKVKEQWGQLTDDDLSFIDGKRDQLVGRVQQRYGL